MKITIIYDNTSFDKELRSDWGFSALIEQEDTPNILFDTGDNGKILLDNMEILSIDPSFVEEVFISHLHHDHTGGLGDLLKANPKIKKVYTPFSLGLNNEVVLKKPQKIHNKVFSTGELDSIEQSMGVKTNKGIVLIVGCSHPYMGTILDEAGKFGDLYAIIGGLHGFSEFDLFKDLKLICPTHCTQHKEELKKLYPSNYLEGGAGRVIEI
jgi:7,8-dihydropterin-6-yl-methyl-4-(beta-D-ribofuranosyl)aminobenzene 5'-phosphate synthase